MKSYILLTLLFAVAIANNHEKYMRMYENLLAHASWTPMHPSESKFTQYSDEEIDQM